MFREENKHDKIIDSNKLSIEAILTAKRYYLGMNLLYVLLTVLDLLLLKWECLPSFSYKSSDHYHTEISISANYFTEKIKMNEALCFAEIRQTSCQSCLTHPLNNSLSPRKLSGKWRALSFLRLQFGTFLSHLVYF